MSDLVAFLRARLDEDEAEARATAPSGTRYRWRTDVQTDDDEHAVGHCVISDPNVAGVAGAWGLERGTGEAVAEHIARHDPARVLRDIEAKRAILDAYVKLNDDVPLQLGDFPRAHGRWDGLSVAVRHLAAVCRDHPDYDPDWAI